jgi:hypothetical protein
MVARRRDGCIMIEKQKKLKTLNGRNVGDLVVIYGGIMLNKSHKATIRQLGVVGFYVKGLATCYYWHEIGRLWRDFDAVADVDLEPIQPQTIFHIET